VQALKYLGKYGTDCGQGGKPCISSVFIQHLRLMIMDQTDVMVNG
jgi:hypothetical protein